MIKIKFLLILILILTACITPPILTKEGNKIIILTQAFEPGGYQVIDVQSATYNQENGAAGACIIELKNIAASLGADAIRTISSNSNEYHVVTLTVEILKQTN